MNKDIAIPEYFPHLLNADKKYKVLYGGRASSKSYSAAIALVTEGMQEKHTIVCAREYQASLRDSVKSLIEEVIEMVGCEDFYEIKRDEVIGRNGTKFLFKGLNGKYAKSLKSIPNITRVWFEESETLSADSIDIVIPTVIRNPGSSFIFVFNPDLITDPVYDMFVTNGAQYGDDLWCKKINYFDNPFLEPSMLDDINRMKEHDPDKYNWVYLGNPRKISDALIFHGVYKVRPVPEPPEDTTLYYGIDFGFAKDPFVITRSWIQGKKLYIDYCVDGVGVEIEQMSDLIDKVPGSKKWRIIADNARPELIDYLKRRNYKVHPSKKGKSSISDGISFIRDHEVIIDPRCKLVIEEFGLYSYKKEAQTGEILPVPVDKTNHTIDSVRYSLEPARKGQQKFHLSFV